MLDFPEISYTLPKSSSRGWGGEGGGGGGGGQFPLKVYNAYTNSYSDKARAICSSSILAGIILWEGFPINRNRSF